MIFRFGRRLEEGEGRGRKGVMLDNIFFFLIVISLI